MLQRGNKREGFLMEEGLFFFFDNSKKILSFLRDFLKHKTMKYKRKIKRICILDNRSFAQGQGHMDWGSVERRGEKRREEGRGGEEK